MNLRTLVLTVCTAALAFAPISASAQPRPRRDVREYTEQTPKPEQGDLQVGSLHRYKVRGDVYMYVGPSGNTVVFIGDNGVLVIDPPGGPAAQELVDDIMWLTPEPIHWVMNTSAEPERLAGNQTVAQAGVALEGGNDISTATGVGAKIFAHEGVLQRLSAGAGEPVGWPTDTYFMGTKDLYINGSGVQLIPVPAAHAAGDSFISLRGADVIVAGDVYTPDRYPKIDLANGGSVQGVLDGLNSLIRMTVPAFNAQGGTLVVPAHGRIGDESDVAEYRDTVTIIRDRIKDMIGKRMTLAQIQAAKPTFDYDVEYGGEAAGRAFVETVYRSLTSGQTKSRR